ncbi:histone chaperone [Hirsutella rhossiliensis]|uniref:Histone chaperone n=1 Tax=Hirsutella rhossiliensis TaxID=111463 RepID=A0A9P8SP36_9HYPO|nr:histone chaperone [Hirsutella rhossiliensis]KAH0967791.1 histone chaperone [Hirsutella rhossiliensis]
MAAAALDSQRLGAVFQSRPDIIEGIKKAADSPARIALFNQITTHVYSQLHDGSDEPAQKRRRVDVAHSNGVANSPVPGNAADEAVLLEVKEISVSAPQRKKLELCFTSNFLYARAPGTVAPIPGITYAWRDIEYAFYLPVPEKAQVQHNYVLFPRGATLPQKTSQPAAEPLVFTVPASAPKEGTIGGSETGSAAAVSDTYKSLLHWAFGKHFKAAGSAIEIVSADSSKFHSVIKQAHRPNEKAVHVNGFRGSKDAISYTNILQITFNIVVEVFLSEGEGTEEIEFGMLDQKDYGGIDDYIKLNRLQDRSMAEQRKGKLQLAENRGPKGAEDGQDGSAGDADANGMTELERAQLEVEQHLQDDEDEDEEDYDPGSEGESGGSGDSSEDDDDDEAEGEDEEEGDSDAEGEVDGEEEEEEEQPQVKKEAKGGKTRVKKEEVQAPVKTEAAGRGWAAISNTRHANDMDMDEKFDVVG